MLHKEAKYFDNKHQRHENRTHRPRQLHVRDLSFEEPNGSHLLHSGTDNDQKRDQSQGSRHRDRTRRTSDERNHAQQVKTKNEEEKCKKKRKEPLVVMLTDGWLGNLIPNKDHERLEEIPNPSLGTIA